MTSSYKSIVWIGTSYKDLCQFPHPVQREIGFALWRAQEGQKHHRAKPLKGFRGVMEIVDNYDTNTYRAIYTTKIGQDIYVLHAFQKKSKSGIKTPQRDLDIIKKRLQEAQRNAKGDT